MNEQVPQIKQPDVFKSLTRLTHPDRWMNEGLSDTTLKMITNTSSAFNLIKAYQQKYSQLPQEWGSDDYRLAQFAFIKDTDGMITKKEGLVFANPSDFIAELRKFYDLADVQTAAEKRKAELQALIASRMPTTPPPEPPPKPSSSPFKFRK